MTLFTYYHPIIKDFTTRTSENAVVDHDSLIKAGYKHTATLNAQDFIEALINCTNDEERLQKLISLKH